MPDILKIEMRGHVADVMLNRPDKHNALSVELFGALGEAGSELAEDRSVRAVVLHGAGENFCSGIDISTFAGAGSTIEASMLDPMAGGPANFFQRSAYAWREIPVPVICAIQGAAFGGGLQVALGADLRYARPDARFSIMEIKWGLIPDLAISTTLRHLVPLDQVKELAWSGRIVDGNEALRLRLVTALHDDPLAAAFDMAQSIAAGSPDAIRGMKALFNRAWQLSDADALSLEATLQRDILGASNQREAVQANFERRAPNFSD
jgi:enoyl-CoA hydratase/carnithine racemase